MSEREQLTQSRTALVDGRPPLVYTHCRIRAIAGPDLGQRLESEKDLIRVGAAPDGDLVIRDPAVSRCHFELRRRKGEYTIVDVGSTNGTLVGSLLVKEATIRKPVEIGIGDTLLLFEPASTSVPFEASGRRECGEMVGDSTVMREIFTVLERVAPTELAILVTGETGTGKELVARAVHQKSRRRAGPFVTLAVSALPPGLLESALFGHEAGALPGATASYAGAFERADGGTLFLDDLGELPADLQPRLLRAIERGEIVRLGGHSQVRVNARLIVAADDDLKGLVQAGKVRDELYYRLAEIRIELPPLREHLEDVPVIAEALLARELAGLADGSVARRIAPAALLQLQHYSFPGNVRELVNMLRQAVASAATEEIGLAHFPPEIAGGRASRIPSTGLSSAIPNLPFKDAKARLLDAFERQYLQDVLDRHGLNVSKAAREAGIDRRHFYRLLDKYEIEIKDRGLED